MSYVNRSQIEEKEVNLLVENISKVYDDEVVEGPSFEQKFVDSEMVVKNEYDLHSKRYTSSFVELIENYEKHEVLVELDKVLSITKKLRVVEKEQYKIVSIKDLNNKAPQ